MKTGTQIIYIPNHANGDINHRDCEEGFVTSIIDETAVFCRFWNKQFPLTLHTLANSERCNAENLIVFETRKQELIDNWLVENGYK